MASSAFKSTTGRDLHAAASSSTSRSSGPLPPPADRRSGCRDACPRSAVCAQLYLWTGVVACACPTHMSGRGRRSAFLRNGSSDGESDKQTQCSISITGSDVSDSVMFSHMNAPGLKIRSNSNDDLDGFDTPQSRSSCFSFTHEPVKNIENCDVRQYLGNFGRGNNKELRETRSSYFADDYVSRKVNPDLLKDMVTFQDRMQYGGLLICNIRTF